MNILSGWQIFVTQRDGALTAVKTLSDVIIRFRLPYQLSQMMDLPLASSMAQGIIKR